MDAEIDSLCSKNDYRAPKPLEIRGNKNNEDKATKMGKKDFQYDKVADVFIIATPRGVQRKTGYVAYSTATKDCKNC